MSRSRPPTKRCRPKASGKVYTTFDQFMSECFPNDLKPRPTMGPLIIVPRPSVGPS